MEVVFLDKCNSPLPSIASLDYGECCMLEHDKSGVYMRIKTNQSLMSMLNLRTGMFTYCAPIASYIPVKVVLNVTKI